MSVHMPGVNFDDLKQRHRERFLRDVVGITLIASFFLLTFAAMLYTNPV
ncbi:MAG: hypothetical protein WA125_09290 [Desulfosporosinus sp.]